MKFQFNANEIIKIWHDEQRYNDSFKIFDDEYNADCAFRPMQKIKKTKFKKNIRKVNKKRKKRRNQNGIWSQAIQQAVKNKKKEWTFYPSECTQFNFKIVES